ncbi:BN159_2729 family protein [Streptomyces sp. NPDC058867]|uniref:BN159_2729 family protein n=1 Tax=unclassified Streptomyces TaxID=2593676 RepID=UPI0036A02F88
MNSNLPRAVGVISAVLDAVRPEQAAAVASALDSAHLLVDPQRSLAAVLRRTPDGGWSRGPRALTDLERRALAWDASCTRARAVADAIESHLAGHAGPSDVRVDGDRVRVVLRVDGPAPWAHWRVYFGITTVGESARPHLVIGEGERDGVRVTVVAHGAAAPAKDDGEGGERLYRLGRVMYDLTLPQRDAHGEVWYFQGWRRHDGMPLMSLDSRPERCSLANVVAHLGPLAPVRSARRDEGAGDPAAAASVVPMPAAPSGPAPASPLRTPAGPVG